jgi:tetratricopeptide (TPR) repeat protein
MFNVNGLKEIETMLSRIVIAIVLFCSAAALSADASVKEKLVAAKAAVMDADYRGDLDRLASLRTEIAALKTDPDLGYLADYWSGFASWRIALNGANAKMPPADLKANLERATADFQSSIQKKDTFADAYAAAASIYGWLAFMNRADAALMKSQVETSARLLARAESLEPSNPRVLWVRGGVFLFSPPTAGGNPDRAIEIYQKQVDASAPLNPKSPLPDWGKVEGLMSLAFAHMIKSTPDLKTSAAEAQAAFKLEPRWHYVRDVLIPQIAAAVKKAEETKP